jgi:energy-coupling factor transporter ATP-binding protein EcfA2
LLNAISGLIESSGEIRGVPGLGPGGVLRVFQEPVALKDTVNSELFLPTLLHNIPACSNELLKLIGLDNYSTRKMESLSGGERQRVLFARDLAMGPSLLLLDEFTSNLDGASIEIMENIVKKHREGGGSAIIVTHNILQARRLSDKILFMHNGGLIDENSDAAKILLSGQWSG